MNRRTYLALTASVTTVGLAGCPGLGPEPLVGEEVNVEEAEAQYETATTALASNKETMDEWATSPQGREQSAIDDLESTLEEAQSAIDAAETNASVEMEGQIEYARAIAAFQAEQIEYHDIAVSFEETEAEAESLGDNEEHEAAANTYGDAIEILDDLRSQTETAETAFTDIDAAVVNEPAIVYDESFAAYFDFETIETIDAYEYATEGKQYVHRMFVELNTGFAQYENEAFAAARDHFETGETHRQTAADAFSTANTHDAAPASLREETDGWLVIVEDLAEMFTLFIDATHEAEAGNFETANQLAADGFAVLEHAFQQN